MLNSKIFVQVDQAGAEALIVAYLCRAGKYRDLFTFNIKPHSYVAAYLFKNVWQSKLATLAGGLGEADDIQRYLSCSLKELKSLRGWSALADLIQSSDDWPANERYYFIAKMVVHASSYGMKGPTFQMNVLEKSEGSIVLSKKQAESYLADFHGMFPEIHEWQRETERIARATKVLYNLQGYPREITEVINETTLRDLYAFVPQSTVGVITNIAYTEMQQYIEQHNKDWDMLANTHDSYLCQCPIKEVNDCATMMHQYITPELTSHRRETFKMKAEVQTGYNWSNYSKDKNPLGLQPYKIQIQ